MIHRLEFHAMGSRMLAIVDREHRPASIEYVPMWFEEYENSLSRFRMDSELTQLNLHTGERVKVSQILWDVFQAAIEAENKTDGLINPLILNALISAGYNQSFEKLQGQAVPTFLDPGQIVASLDEVVTYESERTICIPEGAQLDFGGIAKGWSAHQVMERLKSDGPCLVNAGGDIAISGFNSDGKPWPIGIEDPFNPGTDFELLHIDGGGIATSGRDYHRWMHNGSHQHHIIDPGTGQPAETDILTATVIAPTVMEAETMAKAVLISGSKQGLAWLERNEELAGLIVLENGECLETRNLEKYY